MKKQSPRPKSAFDPSMEKYRLLRKLQRRGALTAQEFALCLLLAESQGEPQRDEFFVWLMQLPPGEMDMYRRSLHLRGILHFRPADTLGSFFYWVLEDLIATSRQPLPLRQPTGFSQVPRWFVPEHGQRAHLLQEDDFFPAERAVCGLPAVDAEQQPLPRFNSRPADYRFCCKCHLFRNLKGGQPQ